MDYSIGRSRRAVRRRFPRGREVIRLLARCACTLLVVVATFAAGEVLLMRSSFSEVYRTLESRASSELAALLGAPSKPARQILVNGQVTSFTVHTTRQSVEEVFAATAPARRHPGQDDTVPTTQ